MKNRDLPRHLFLRFHRQESGAALTEFAITLPIFVLLLTGLLHLGHLGQVTVAVKNLAYKEMWIDANQRTQGYDLEHMSPRGQLASLTADVDGISPVEMINGMGNIAGGLGGHWGESRMYAELGNVLSVGGVHYSNRDTDIARRLDKNMPGMTEMTSSILGSDKHRPKFAFDDNLVDSEQNLMENFSGGTGMSGLVTGALASLLELTGMGPGYLAGIRYGDGSGSATAEVDLQNRLLSYTHTFENSYSTALSPLAGDNSAIPGLVDDSFGSVGRENYQWLFYYLMGQTILNQRVNLDIVDQDFDKNDSFTPAERYE